MKYAEDVVAYNAAQKDEHATICEALMKLFSKTVAEADAKVWHGHPVWFIDGNPIVGYHLQKSGLRILFWSGQSFASNALTPVGNFQAAGMGVDGREGFDVAAFEGLLAQSREIQWDYANLPKRRALEKLTSF